MLAGRWVVAICALLWGSAGLADARTEAMPGLEPFIDGIVAQQAAAPYSPGTIVVVVKDGRVILSKGYGWQTLAPLRPADPATSMFRIASISKLFVAVAVMQLVEQGRLSLDEDVGRIVGMRFDRPVSVRQLLTHRGGFDASTRGVFGEQDQPAPSLARVVGAAAPPQAYRPGTVPAYSNYGFVLLGRVVERKSGMAYADYVARHIFAPLGVRCETLSQPVEPRFSSAVVGAHDWSAGNWRQHPFEIIAASPGGGISISADDMGRFMTAMLAPQSPLLGADARRRLTEVAARHDPRVAGMGLGFPLQTLNGRPAWYHTGGINYARSRLTVLSDEDFAIFVAVNGVGRGGADSELVAAVLDRYFPAPARPPFRPPSRPLTDYAGSYQLSGSHEVTYLALASAAMQTQVVAAGGDMLRVGTGDSATLWRSIGDDRFLQVSGTDSPRFGEIVFGAEPATGKIMGYARVNQPTRVLLKRSGLRDWAVMKQVLDGMRLAVAGLLLASLVTALRRRTRPEIWAAVLILCGSAAFRAFAVRYGLGDSTQVAGEIQGLSIDGPTRLTLALPWIGGAAFVCSGLVLLRGNRFATLAGATGLAALATGTAALALSGFWGLYA